MQTETIFRAAQAIETITDAFRMVDPTLAISLSAKGGKLFVVVTGAMAHERAAVADEVQTICEFTLHTVNINGTATQFEVR